MDLVLKMMKENAEEVNKRLDLIASHNRTLLNVTQDKIALELRVVALEKENQRLRDKVRSLIELLDTRGSDSE